MARSARRTLGHMCILVIALGCHPNIPFLCAHNREENRGRPSSDDRWEADSQIVCGRDSQAGGMVLGVHGTQGHFAALTNCRSHVQRGPGGVTSRGRLVEHLVAKGPGAAQEFFGAHTFDGFHVVFGDIFGADPQMQYRWNAPVDTAAEGTDTQWCSGGSELQSGEVFVVSNENPAAAAHAQAAQVPTATKTAPDSTAAGGSWPKCQWLRRQVADFLRALPADPDMEGVHAGISEIMERYDVPDVLPPDRLPTKLNKEKELLLHTGPFAPWRETFQTFGTVSQRVLISDARGQELHYLYRSTNVGWEPAAPERPPRRSAWERIRIPWAAPTDGTAHILERQPKRRHISPL
uniref:Uncharacterized protein n=1 Tax=Pyrodinium bahamense TaxID=73915 RepID=A0A7S0A3J1_9DINO